MLSEHAVRSMLWEHMRWEHAVRSMLWEHMLWEHAPNSMLPEHMLRTSSSEEQALRSICSEHHAPNQTVRVHMILVSCSHALAHSTYRFCEVACCSGVGRTQYTSENLHCGSCVDKDLAATVVAMMMTIIIISVSIENNNHTTRKTP